MALNNNRHKLPNVHNMRILVYIARVGYRQAPCPDFTQHHIIKTTTYTERTVLHAFT